MSQKCENCIHTIVCNIKTEYFRVKEKVDNFQIETGYPIRVKVECSQFMKDERPREAFSLHR